MYKDVAGYLSTPSDEGNYALKVGTGQYAAALANGMYRAVEAVVGEVTTQYIIRYIPNSTDAKKQFREYRRQGESGEREGAGQRRDTTRSRLDSYARLACTHVYAFTGR